MRSIGAAIRRTPSSTLNVGAWTSVEFSDATTRLVYEDAHGQHVMDDWGKALCGLWYVPREELDVMFGPKPIIVDGDESADV